MLMSSEISLLFMGFQYILCGRLDELLCQAKATQKGGDKKKKDGRSLVQGMQYFDDRSSILEYNKNTHMTFLKAFFMF